MLLLRGTEELSFELGGSVAEHDARARLPPELEPALVAGRARVALTVFRMRGLRLRGLPGPGLDYSEALWRLAVQHRGELAWLAVACDLDSAPVRLTGRALIRYPVREASLGLADDGFSVRAADAVLAIELGDPATAELESPGTRPLLVASGGRLWRVPWAEVPAPESRCRALEVRADTLSQQTLGAVDWDPVALWLRGRGHRCGRATDLTSVLR
ncbi:MAG: DUF2071 domain-containing protein [Polyangiaceae bacterium]|nr:DUF2071 domain-containing protein [Polyangiaceae bacterium]